MRPGIPTVASPAGPAPRSSDRWRGPRTALAALARTQEVLLAPRAFADDVAWRTALAAEARALFGADHALVLLAGAGRPYVGDGVDAGALDALAAFHPVPSQPAGGRPDAADARRVRYRDPALERLHARRLAVADPVFTRAGNEAAMGRRVDGTAMFDAVCRPLGITDFHGVFARTGGAAAGARAAARGPRRPRCRCCACWPPPWAPRSLCSARSRRPPGRRLPPPGCPGRPCCARGSA